jgi:hypothetical protein
MSKILRDANGNFKKGYSANPGGRKGTEFGNWLRNNPKSMKVWEKILSAGLKDDDPRQTIAWKLIADRTAPSLRATKLNIKDTGKTPVIMIPSSKPEGSPVDTPISYDPSIKAEA